MTKYPCFDIAGQVTIKAPHGTRSMLMSGWIYVPSDHRVENTLLREKLYHYTMANRVPKRFKGGEIRQHVLYDMRLITWSKEDSLFLREWAYKVYNPDTGVHGISEDFKAEVTVECKLAECVSLEILLKGAYVFEQRSVGSTGFLISISIIADTSTTLV